MAHDCEYIVIEIFLSDHPPQPRKPRCGSSVNYKSFICAWPAQRKSDTKIAYHLNSKVRKLSNTDSHQCWSSWNRIKYPPWPWTVQTTYTLAVCKHDLKNNSCRYFFPICLSLMPSGCLAGGRVRLSVWAQIERGTDILSTGLTLWISSAPRAHISPFCGGWAPHPQSLEIG